jgi:hypothetical protein
MSAAIRVRPPPAYFKSSRALSRIPTSGSFVRVTSVSEGGDRQGAGKLWLEGVVGVAGALGGLAGMVYVIGAATVWLRYRLIGLPSDVIVLHEPRATVVALGMRGLVAVGVALIVLAALAWFVAWVAWRIWAYLSLTPEERKDEFGKPLRSVAEVCSARFRPGYRRLVVSVAGLAILGSAFVSWRVFAVAVVILVPLAAAFRALRLAHNSRNATLSTVMLVTAAAVIAGFSWQITPSIPVQSVLVDPPLPSQNVAAPYFGESSDYVYVGVVRRDPKTKLWEPCRQILELPRKKVGLTFIGPRASFHRANQSPAVTAIRLLKGQTAVEPRPACGE